MNKPTVLILFGGHSTEHEVSVISARNVIQAIDKKKYNPILVGISKDSGTWYYFLGDTLTSDITTITDKNQPPQYLVNLAKQKDSVSLVNDDRTINIPIQFVLPILHGKYGEDGCLQGMCRMLGIPFAGPSVTASAVCMDKDFTKRILASSNIPVVPYITLYAKEEACFETITEKLGSTLFIKPANTGSSVGVYKIKSRADFDQYIPIVFQYDEKVIIEQAVTGREIECAVLGNETPKVSILGEVKPNHEFYSYDAKYLDPDGADLIIPAPLDEDITRSIQSYALKAYTIMGCKGLSRIDFFVTSTNEIYLNELNTLPGFTNISMYPKLLETSGIGYSDLISHIIEFGFLDYAKWINFSTEHHLI